jgi:hypothetical protein
MTTSIWEAKGPFGLGTLQKARGAFWEALSGGLPLPKAYAFVGYALEQYRQKSSGMPSPWPGAVKSGHRYARGKHAQHYRSAGKRAYLQLIFPEVARLAGLASARP